MKKRNKPPTGWFWFGCEYEMDDRSVWVLNIMAQSQEDAETRLRCIGQNGRVGGRLIEEIEVCSKCLANVPLVHGLCPACRMPNLPQ